MLCSEEAKKDIAAEELLSEDGVFKNNIVTEVNVRTFTAVVEKCPDTGLYVGYVPGFPGAHTQAETLDELQRNLREVIEMLLEDGEPTLEAEFIGTQTVMVA